LQVTRAAIFAFLNLLSGRCHDDALRDAWPRDQFTGIRQPDYGYRRQRPLFSGESILSLLMWMISGFVLVEFSPDSTPLETRLQSQ
jgi:hypothetical protein